MTSINNNQFEFEASVVKLINEHGGTCAVSAPCFEALIKSIKLPSLHEFNIIIENIDRDGFQNLYESTKDDSQKTLLSALQENSKSFYYRCGEPMAAIGKNGWAPETPETYAREIIKGEELIMLEIGFWDGKYPDSYFVCLTDPNPSDPYVYSTDHACLFQVNEIYNNGTLSEFLNKFIRPKDINETLIENLLKKIRNNDPEFLT